MKHDLTDVHYIDVRHMPFKPEEIYQSFIGLLATTVIVLLAYGLFYHMGDTVIKFIRVKEIAILPTLEANDGNCVLHPSFIMIKFVCKCTGMVNLAICLELDITVQQYVNDVAMAFSEILFKLFCILQILDEHLPEAVQIFASAHKLDKAHHIQMRREIYEAVFLAVCKHAVGSPTVDKHFDQGSHHFFASGQIFHANGYKIYKRYSAI
jgi:succinate dehydrogenase flavin-adding protein (antitoxin of CptAB toxin-antitoxin module)